MFILFTKNKPEKNTPRHSQNIIAGNGAANSKLLIQSIGYKESNNAATLPED